MEVFAACSEVNNLFEGGNDLAARNMLIRLLGDLDRSRTPYPQVLNSANPDGGSLPVSAARNCVMGSKVRP